MPDRQKAKNGSGALPRVPFWKVVRAGLQINMTALPVLYIAINLVSIAHGVSHGVSTYVTQLFYDSVEKALRTGAAARLVFASVLAMGGVFVGRELLNGLHNFMQQVAFRKGSGETSRRIHAKMGRIDPVCLEDTALQDLINKAQEGAGNTIFIMNLGITVFTFYLPYFLFMGFYLNHVNPKFILAILCVFVPTLFGQLLKTRIIAKFEDEAAPIRRRFEFYDSTMTSREFFKETRLLGAFKMLMGRFLETCRELSAAEWKATKRKMLWSLPSPLSPRWDGAGSSTCW